MAPLVEQLCACVVKGFGLQYKVSNEAGVQHLLFGVQVSDHLMCCNSLTVKGALFRAASKYRALLGPSAKSMYQADPWVHSVLEAVAMLA